MSAEKRFSQNCAAPSYNRGAMANALAVPGIYSKDKLEKAQPAGFLAGLWHGMIAPFTFFVSIWDTTVSVYETHNNGRSYELGFILGLAVCARNTRFYVGNH